MASTKYSALPAAASVVAGDEWGVNESGTSKKVTAAQVATFVGTTNASSTTPAAIGTAAVGVGTTNARADHVHATGAGTPSTQAFGDAAAVGTGPAAAMTDHKHAMPSERAAASTTPAAVGTAAVGVGTTDARADHVHATGAGTPSTQAFGDAAATGSGPAAAMTDHKHAMPSFATNAVLLGTAAAAGAATTPLRSNDTIAAFDATAPVTQAFGDAAAVGSIAFAARRDHVHGMPSFATNAILLGTAAAAGAATTPFRSNDTIAAFDATVPVTQAFADTAGTGSIAFAARRDHKHGMPAAPTAASVGASANPHGAADHTDITRSLYLSAALAGLDVATASTVGASPDLTKVVAYADAATQGAYWSFQVPSDWASGVITLQPVWSPGSTDGTAHTVRWSITAKTAAAGTTVTSAGTTVTFTGSSAARTVGVLVYDTATSTTLTPAAANDLFRFELQRIGADGADTYVGVVNLLGVVVTYTANQ